MDRFANIPSRIAKLPVSDHGFPIPWFAATVEGKRDFRVVDEKQMDYAVRHKRCWVCGEPLGKFMAFVIGPMCGINRTISDPPSHLECATFSALNCPFLSRPLAKRNSKDVEHLGTAAGFGIKRNPGVSGVWVTTDYKRFRAYHGAEGFLFEIGKPESLTWYANGRVATDEEVIESVVTGLPYLKETATAQSPQAKAELYKMIAVFEKLTGLSFSGD